MSKEKTYTYISYRTNMPHKAYVGMTRKHISSGYKGSGARLPSRRLLTRVNLGYFDSREEAHYWEGFYIKHLKTHISNGGYNVCENGGGLTTHGKQSATVVRKKVHTRKKNKKKQEAFNQRIWDQAWDREMKKK